MVTAPGEWATTHVPGLWVRSPGLDGREGWRGSRTRGSPTAGLCHDAAVAPGWPCPRLGRVRSVEPLFFADS